MLKTRVDLIERYGGVMDLLECICSRRSGRSYTDEKISTDVMDELIRLGTMAATGSNEQPWGFLILDGKEELDRISEEIKGYLKENMELYPYLKQYEGWMVNPNFHVFNNAQTVLIIYGNSQSHWHVYDCSLAASNIMLAAETMNIGTCWIGFAEYWFNTEAFKMEHGVPNEYEMVAPLSMGYKAKSLNPPKRKDAVIFNRV